MKDKILKILKENSENFISGESISKQLGVTRAAIWKHINALKENGYNIESVPKKGYRLSFCPDLLIYEEMKNFLKTKYIGQNIIHFDEIDSTNSYAKEVAMKIPDEGSVIIAEKQTNGRGRLGRIWSSQNNLGIWMSMILKPKIDIYEVAKITQVAAAAVSLALGKMGIEAYIKWPNDIIINDKKICGILTEMSSEINAINYVVVGIGLNVNHEESDFSEEIKNIASSLFIETKAKVNRNILAAEIMNEFEGLYEEFKNGDISKALKICKKNSYVIGKIINIIKGQNVEVAKALDLNEEGELVVMLNDGNISTLSSGEVSVRLK